jgi:hypothetical protein
MVAASFKEMDLAFAMNPNDTPLPDKHPCKGGAVVVGERMPIQSTREEVV